MFSPTLHSTGRIAILICCAIIVLFIGTLAFAQGPVYIVTGHDDSSVYGYDLNTSTLQGSANAGYHGYWTAVGPNPRLIFVGSVYYVSVLDATIKREIKRIYGVYPSTGAPAFSPDGKWLLFADSGNYTLDVVDVATLKLVRAIRLAGAMGSGIYTPGSVVVVGHKAYVTSNDSYSSQPAIAVVDLRTFKVRSIAIPTGYFDGYLYSSPNAAATADGKYVVIAQTSYVDYLYHLLFIDTRTNQLAQDVVIANDPLGLVISPLASPAYGYLVGYDTDFNFSATAIDLNPGSPTFGQLLPQTEVLLSPSSAYYCSGVALSGDGGKLVVTAWQSSTHGPRPNATVVATGLMFTDPSQAVVGQATVGNGERTGGVTVATVNGNPPPTAPTVTGVSGNVTNDTATTIHVTGSNFLAGAQVRIGNMVPLPATVNSPTDLQVTVPKNAPAGPNQDVIVTNPLTTSPPAQQNQSGLLAGGLSILLNPAFQPNYQFATIDYGDYTMSIYDFNQGAMVQPASTPPALYGLAFNFDGAELYSGSLESFWHRFAQILTIDLASDSVEAANPTGGALASYNTMALSVNPANGSPVIYIAARGTTLDLVVYMVDSNPSSPTFNMVIQTLSAGLAQGAIPAVYSMAATPDGKYVYVNYIDADSGFYYIEIFNVLQGSAVPPILTSGLNVQSVQIQISVTPATPAGGPFLLLQATSGGIAVFDISTNPTNPTPVTTITYAPPAPGGPSAYYFYGYQVVGTHLFAYTIGQVVVFNINPNGVSYLNSYSLANAGLVTGGGSPFFAVSPDGAEVYVQPGGEDEITVLDGNALVAGQPPLLTKLAAGRRPWQIAVSPMAHSSKQKASAPIDGAPSGQSGNHPVGISQPPARERLQSSHNEREHSTNSQ